MQKSLAVAEIASCLHLGDLGGHRPGSLEQAALAGGKGGEHSK